MTDNEIIKALELCIEGGDGSCTICPYANIPNCYNESGKDILDLIKRQKAEIERLKGGQDLSNEIQQHYKVEIVRCKDCVLKFESSDGYVYCHHTGMPIKQNGYCDWGTKGINAHPTEKGGVNECVIG